MSAKECACLRAYIVEAEYADRGKYYRGRFPISAYSREEALAQFRERRWELTERQQKPITLTPMGKECELTCEPDVEAQMVKP